MPAFIWAPTSALMPESVTNAPSLTSWAWAAGPAAKTQRHDDRQQAPQAFEFVRMMVPLRSRDHANPGPAIAKRSVAVDCLLAASIPRQHAAMSDPKDPPKIPIAFELFKNAIFSIADEMALTVFRTTYSGVLKDNMDYSTGFADAERQAGGAGPDAARPSRLGADGAGSDHAPLRRRHGRRATSSS